MTLNHCFKIPGLILAAAFLASMGFGSKAFAQELTYLIDLNSRKAVQLPVLDPTSKSTSTSYKDLNDAGQVVGDFWHAERVGSYSRAFFTGPDATGITYLDPPSEENRNIWASGINNAGQVTGTAQFDLANYFFTQERAFITGPGGIGMKPLAALEASDDPDVFYGPKSEGWGINESGQVVGRSSSILGGSLESTAFITGPNGEGMRDLGALGDYYSEAGGINDSGQVVGVSLSADIFGAFITGPDGEGMRALGNLALGGAFTIVADINDSGQVAGSSYTTDSAYHAFITGPDGMGMSDLGTLGGHNSYAYDINNAGQVVGESDTGNLSASGRAFITGVNGEGMTDLNSLVDLPEGVVLASAFAINNSGQVLVTSIPEPETYALMLVGLGLVGFMVRRKKSEDQVQKVQATLALQLSGSTIHRKLAALASLFEHLCESNAVTHNPVKGVKRPVVESQQGKPRHWTMPKRRLVEHAGGGYAQRQARPRDSLGLALSWLAPGRTYQAQSIGTTCCGVEESLCYISPAQSPPRVPSIFVLPSSRSVALRPTRRMG
ncbi:HAF repeat-containing PEP-CTERM protein [Nitrosospira briensis]|uniref:HAF repeat-containing PEP-CTERM protein n=1 Tax=Nitrosospira briensis TaxID=35799 RepID=UPI0008EB8543|nr:HAF repeat-containing PEP-CTERM protein [Nitrosospira briensis]SFN67271.1 PEP-CTERM protein-sorting domain-containing protein [Nitrosospira briensis]